jgi:predicted permease
MNLFSVLVNKLLSLYVIIFIGWIAGKFLKLDARPLARLLIYILVPIVFFDAILKAPLSLQEILLPFIFLFFCSSLSFIFYKISSRYYNSPTKNIIAFSAGSANTGYFGIPATLFILGEAYLPKAILVIFGYVFYENTFGFYITARGHFTVNQAIKKVLRLPSLYAFLFAVLLNLAHQKLPALLVPVAEIVRSSYTLLGLMIVGLGASQIHRGHFDFKFISLTFLAKFIFFPTLVSLLIYFDKNYFHLYQNEIHKILFLMSLVPLAANGVALATELKADPEKVAIAILLSTLFALFYIPLMVIYFMPTG